MAKCGSDGKASGDKVASRRISVSWLCKGGIHLEQLSDCGFHWHLLCGEGSLVFLLGMGRKAHRSYTTLTQLRSYRL